jgi:hypothetical protein
VGRIAERRRKSRKPLTFLFPSSHTSRGEISRKENLSAGRRYRLFLVAVDRDQQRTWTDSFLLEPHVSYYRGEELSRGVVPLVDSTSENPSPEQPPGSRKS